MPSALLQASSLDFHCELARRLPRPSGDCSPRSRAGSWVWVAPGEPRPSPDELAAMGRSMTEACHRYAATNEYIADTVEEALDDAGHTSGRPDGSSPFTIDDDDDEFAEVEIFVTAPEAASESESAVGVSVDVLGPVEVVGWVEPPRRKILTELACYLALHSSRAVSSDELRAALAGGADRARHLLAQWWRPKTRRQFPDHWFRQREVVYLSGRFSSGEILRRRHGNEVTFGSGKEKDGWSTRSESGRQNSGRD